MGKIRKTDCQMLTCAKQEKNYLKLLKIVFHVFTFTTQNLFILQMRIRSKVKSQNHKNTELRGKFKTESS